MVNIIRDGDLFTVPADILINPVNRMGISGAGLAKEFKRRFPKHEEQWRENTQFPMGEYSPNCETFQSVHKSEIFLTGKIDGVMVLYLPTKHNPKDTLSDVDLIAICLRMFRNLCKRNPEYVQTVGAVNMPALGCGLGGLDFEGLIKPLILDMFQNEPYTINLFEPK